MTLPIAGFWSSGIFGILGIWTKFKYHNNPIHIIPAKTWKNLNNQLQKRISKSNPPLAKNRPKNNTIANAIEAWIVFGSDDKKLPIFF